MDFRKYLDKGSLAIFLFHGVIERQVHSVRNYKRKHLEAGYFRKLLNELLSAGAPLSMEEVAQHHISQTPFPPNSFAVTFDDGFENNYSVAAPILKELKIPATIYITTGFIEHNGMSWIDRIEYAMEISDSGRLKLPWSKNEARFNADNEKIRILDDIRLHVKKNKHFDVDDVVSDIFSQLGLPEVSSSDDPLDLKMSWKQVSSLAADDNFIIGGHSHRHAILSFLSGEMLRNEIQTSISYLKDKAGLVSHHYSYPEGLEHCYNQEVIDVLKSFRIMCCPTAIDGVNSLKTDLFHLKRISVI